MVSFDVDLSRRVRRDAVLGGIGYVLVLVASVALVYGLEFLTLLIDPRVGPFLWWALLGGLVVGGLVTAVFRRNGLVSPAVTVVIVYGVAMVEMWRALRAPAPLLPGTPLDLYLVGWPVLLGLVIVSSVVEHLVRTAKIFE